jgi:hypothetical protein
VLTDLMRQAVKLSDNHSFVLNQGSLSESRTYDDHYEIVPYWRFSSLMPTDKPLSLDPPLSQPT